MRAIRSHFIVGIAMLSAVSLTLVLSPRPKVTDQEPPVSLETVIPERFGEWKQEETVVDLIVNPEARALLDKIYSQTLTRNYINRKGGRIMLSIAYGGRQSTSMQVHRPEMCYPAQGFEIGKVSKGFVALGDGTQLPVMKLVATQGRRIEPITYWVMIGDSAVRGGLEQSLVRVKYGLTGKVPHGILIRVSAIGADEAQSFRLEEQFVRDMLGAVPSEYRKILVGELG